MTEKVACEIREQAAQPTLVVRTTTPVRDLRTVMGRAFGLIAEYLGKLGEAPAGAPFAAYHNMDMEHLDVEIGFPVGRPLPAEGEVHAGEIPGGQQATCTFVGPYDEIAAAYESLTAMVRERNLAPTGVAYEFYLNDPTTTPPQELVTKIVFPLQGQ